MEACLLIDQIKISRKGEYTCPVKSLAVFVHNQDIQENDKVLSLLDDIKELDQVLALPSRYPDFIPPICNDILT